uniref:Uncharacterized protein n=1 Tax=Timema shepardi TaxID=629360 RepID=A0A7R9FXG1_TIMSH|nr:unnamed protein product [Timema shepardi]
MLQYGSGQNATKIMSGCGSLDLAVLALVDKDNLTEVSLGKAPRKVLHFSDGTLEEYSTDEDESDIVPTTAVTNEINPGNLFSPLDSRTCEGRIITLRNYSDEYALDHVIANATIKITSRVDGT